ncbi:hypothetical protein CRYUN_Cryun10bG0058100 [Craigia yunnanensis]
MENIWEAKIVLQQGMSWKVRNGQSIQIWRDKWLLFNPSFLPQSLQCDWDVNGRVHDLINEQTMNWNWSCVHEMFMPREVEAICSLPVSKQGWPDVLVLHHDKEVVYMVRSGYLMLYEEGDATLEQS